MQYTKYYGYFREDMRNSFNFLLIALICMDSAFLVFFVLDCFRRDFGIVSDLHLVRHIFFKKNHILSLHNSILSDTSVFMRTTNKIFVFLCSTRRQHIICWTSSGLVVDQKAWIEATKSLYSITYLCLIRTQIFRPPSPTSCTLPSPSPWPPPSSWRWGSPSRGTSPCTTRLTTARWARITQFVCQKVDWKMFYLSFAFDCSRYRLITPSWLIRASSSPILLMLSTRNQWAYFYLRRSRQVIERWELLLLLGGDYFEVIPYYLISNPKFSSGWDPCLQDQISFRGGIRVSQIRFLFGVGSRAP